MSNRRFVAGAAAAALAGWMLAGPAALADKGGHHPASSLKILLTDPTGIAVTHTGANCAQSETVFLSVDSRVHAVAVPQRNQAHVNMADVTGTGNVSGEEYDGTGAKKFTIAVPASGTGTVTLPKTDFALEHTSDGCASSPLPVTVTLGFKDFKLDAGTSTAVAGP